MSRQSQSQSQRRSSQKVPKELKRPENFESMVKYTVKTILSLSVSKIPFKRTEIAKVCLDNEVKYFPMVMEEAGKRLENIYHLDIHELERIGDPFTYIVTAKRGVSSPLMYTKEQAANLTLLHLILTLIFMKGGSITETGLWEYLRDMDIDKSEHEFFGEVGKLVEETFIKQLYLFRCKRALEGSNEVVMTYLWGKRAHIEFDKKEILRDACENLNVSTITFIQQYEKAFGVIQEDDIEDILANEATQMQTQRKKRSTAMEIDDSDDDDDDNDDD